jgi:hypothetical protein
MYKCSGCSSVFAGGNDLLQHFKTCTAGVS